MNLLFQDLLIPGTILKQSEMDGLTGMAFLKRVFFVSDGVMLTQIRKISGIDSSTLQNWTKRGWVPNSHSKKYDMDQVAHILIINMLRSCMSLEKIDFLIRFINGEPEDRSDDIVSDAMLYDYICRIINRIVELGVCDLHSVRDTVSEITCDYWEPIDGARDRLNRALEVIVVTHFAARIKHYATDLLDWLEEDEFE